MEEPVLQRIARGDQRAVSDALTSSGMSWALAEAPVAHARPFPEMLVSRKSSSTCGAAPASTIPRKVSEKVFITTIARRRLIDRLRRSAHEPARESTESLDAVAGRTRHTRGDSASKPRRPRALLRACGLSSQQVLELRHSQGLSHWEIAAKTGMALGQSRRTCDADSSRFAN